MPLIIPFGSDLSAQARDVAGEIGTLENGAHRNVTFSLSFIGLQVPVGNTVGVRVPPIARTLSSMPKPAGKQIGRPVFQPRALTASLRGGW